MQPVPPSFANFAKGLAVLSQQRATGELILSSVEKQWHLYLFLGRLVYATGGTHRVRRWYRAVKQNCHNLKFAAYNYNQNQNQDEWEYHLLKWAINQNLLTLSQAKSIISQVIDEVFFELISQTNLKSSWSAKKLHPIALLDVNQSLYTATELKNKWRNMSLGQLSPYAALIVKQPNFENFQVSKNFFGIVQLVNGDNTIWDIASQLQQCVATTAGHVLQMMNEGIIELSTVLDVHPPLRALNSLPPAVKHSQSLVFIEDTKPAFSSPSSPVQTQSGLAQELGRVEEIVDYSSVNSVEVRISSPVISIADSDSSKIITTAADAKTPSSQGAFNRHENSYHPRLDFTSSSVNSVKPKKGGHLIAYIDDSQSDTQKMSYVLSQAGYEFISVQEPIAALPMLLEHKPSLIFLDLVMPIANGYEICTQIRRVSLLKNTPVIILTSNDGIVDRVRARMAGSSGFLAKPITSEKVLKILKKYLPYPISAQLEKLQRVEI